MKLLRVYDLLDVIFKQNGVLNQPLHVLPLRVVLVVLLLILLHFLAVRLSEVLRFVQRKQGLAHVKNIVLLRLLRAVVEIQEVGRVLLAQLVKRVQLLDDLLLLFADAVVRDFLLDNRVLARRTGYEFLVLGFDPDLVYRL